MPEEPQHPPLGPTARPRTCRVRGRKGRYYLLKLCPRKARVTPTEMPHGPTILVNKEDLRDIRRESHQPALFQDPPEPPGPCDATEADPTRDSPPTDNPEDRPLPYGLLDLDPAVVTEAGPPFRVRCYVRDCGQMLRPPTRGYRGEVCPSHGIRCHLSGSNPTYAFGDPARNIIIAPEIFASRLLGNPHKFETHRFGLEKSEDCLTWNVFCSLQEARCLHEVARFITGLDLRDEPRLYLWGLSLWDGQLRPWNLLLAARKRFESSLPVTRPSTEPDIGLHLRNRYLILIEAKFTSANTFYASGPRKDKQSLTREELLDIYRDPALTILDVDRAKSEGLVYYQLWRNLTFSEYMASLDSPRTLAFHANLVRAGYEHESTGHFRQLLRPGFTDRFARITWENLFTLSGLHWRKLARLQEYMLTKTAALVPAFHLDAW